MAESVTYRVPTADDIPEVAFTAEGEGVYVHAVEGWLTPDTYGPFPNDEARWFVAVLQAIGAGL